MSIDIDGVGLNMGQPEEQNVIITMADESRFREDGSVTDFDRAAKELEGIQSKYIGQRQEVIEDKTLDENQTDYVVYNNMQEYTGKANAVLDKMQGMANSLEHAHTQKLFTNDLETHWSKYTEKMLSIPSINEKIFNDPIGQIQNKFLAPIVCLHALSDMLSPSSKEAAIKSLNLTYTPNHVDGIEIAQLQKTRIDLARKGVTKQRNMLAVTEKRYSELNASKELRAKNIKMGLYR